MNTITKNSRIAIFGGGISGLSLAIFLLEKGYKQIKIFEKDETFQSRKQGYGLTILQGKKVLRELGVLQQVKSHNSPTRAHYFFNEKGRLLGFYGTIFWDGLKHNRSRRWSEKGLSMHIPRQKLRQILLNKAYSLSPGDQLVQWSSKPKTLKCHQDAITIDVDPTGNIQADLVIGCDGIYSGLRQLSVINDNKLNFLGCMIVLGICSSSHNITKERIFQSSNGQGRFYCMPFNKDSPEQSSMWQFSIPMQQTNLKKYKNDPQMLKAFLLSYFSGWHAPVPELVFSTKHENMMILAAFDRDPQQTKTIDSRIILLGDACHPMSPFKSQGANQALLDAFNLSQVLQKQQDLNIVVDRFTRQQASRTSSKVLKSRQRVQKYHTPQYLSEQSYIYPKIDRKLIDLINQADLNFQVGEDFENKIISIMKREGYLS